MPRAPYIPVAFAGWTLAQMQAELTNVQSAISQLATGNKAEVISYSQAQGNRSVTYSRAQLAYLQERAQTLAAIIYPGQGYGRRAPPRIRYR